MTSEYIHHSSNSGWPLARTASSGQLDTGLPVIDSPEAAVQALGELLLANADRGDDAANDYLIAELVPRIRAQQDCGDGGRGQPPSPAGRGPRHAKRTT